MKLVALAALGFGLAQAPLQCSREPDDVRRYETPPEALHALALKFRSQGDERAYRETLRYIAEHYPNSRFAIAGDASPPGDAGRGSSMAATP